MCWAESGSGNAWFSIARVVAFEEPETGLSAGFKGVKSGSEDTDESLLVMEVGARNARS